MTFFQKRDSKYFEEGARSLIKAITGFEEDDENFEICLNFTLSNFLHHRFLEVNSHQVRRTVDGLCEKFTIQSHYEKAEALHTLSSSLFESISKEGSTEQETDYAVLSLLLHLSESVDANQEIIKVLDDDEDGEKSKEEIDWAEYLQEGEEEYVAFSDEDKLWSDGEEEDSLEEDFFTCPPRRDDSGIDISPESNSIPPQIQFQSSEATYPASKQTWLHHYIKSPYWNSQHQVSSINPPSETLSANLTKEWEKHMQKETVIYNPDTKAMLTEDVIIRESLWMLHGVKNLYLFSWDGTQFSVNRDVHLSHLTSNTLAELLSKLCMYGNKVVVLHDFVDKAYSPHSHSSHHCQTYQAYATSLCSSLKQFSDLLASVEKQVISQEETLTLSQLFQKLKPCLENLELISCIHSEAVEKCPPNSSSRERAVRLLTVLWKHLAQSNTWMSTSTVQTVLSLFLKTIRPYFNLLEGLVKYGCLEDPCQEFIVQRKGNVSVLDKEFWWTAISLQDLPSDVGSDFFLKPLLPSILLAGKSMEMLRHLGHLSEITSVQDSSGSLYSQLLMSVRDMFNKLVEASGPKENCESGDKCDLQNHVDQNKGCVEWEKYIPSDPLLQKNFEDILNSDGGLNYIDNSDDIEKILENLRLDVLLPLNLILEGAMHSCIRNACNVSCSKLIQVLKEKHHLMDHVSVMKKYYLMESGDVMFSFYSEIFQKICCGDKWQDLSFLFLALQDAISKQDEETAQRLSIFLKNENQVISKPLSHLDSLQLFYEAQWPIKVVLSSDAQKQYCQVFCFLLQVKCAKYVLDELRFADLQCDEDESDVPAIIAFIPKPDIPKEQKIHGMFLLRMRLLHFVNGFHTYVMTSILHSSGQELDEELEKVENLDQVIHAHSRYLSSLHERCLLDTKLSLLKEQIFRILNLSLKFQQLWQSGINKVSLEELENIEKEFNSCHNLLTSYLNKPLKRGAYPHLKALACAVLYTSPLQQIFQGS